MKSVCLEMWGTGVKIMVGHRPKSGHLVRLAVHFAQWGITLSNTIANIALKIFCGSKSHAPFISIVILEIGRTVAGISWHKHS